VVADEDAFGCQLVSGELVALGGGDEHVGGDHGAPGLAVGGVGQDDGGGGQPGVLVAPVGDGLNRRPRHAVMADRAVAEEVTASAHEPVVVQGDGDGGVLGAAGVQD